MARKNKKNTNTPKKKSFYNRFLNGIEKAGNALPHPATLFAIFALLALLFSWIASMVDWQAVQPGTDKTIHAVNLLSRDGLHMILTRMVKNFTDFAPLGIVLVALLGIGIAEHSGLIGAAIRKLVLSAPNKMLTFILVLAGILSNIASDVGYVLLIPLAGIIFLAVGRHPIIGMAAAFAGVSGGFSANLLLGTIDPLLAGLSTEAAQIIDPLYEVNPTANYFFMVASTFIIAFAGTWVTERIIAPRFGEYKGDEKFQELDVLSKRETKGLRLSGLAGILLVIIFVAGIIPSDGIFRGPRYHLKSTVIVKLEEKQVPKEILYELKSISDKDFKNKEDFEAALSRTIGENNIDLYGEEINSLANISDDGLLNSPLIKGIVALLFIMAGVMGIVYGIVTKKYRSDADVVKGMGESMKTLALYIVLVFFAAQFVEYFKWSNLGVILAIKGADAINNSGMGLIPLVIMFIILSASINMLMGSASAKWAIIAPVFIPMFMILGYSPELSQVIYRIGDSVTNVISPMMSFFALIIAFMQKYDKKAGIGTIVATMLPYSIVFFILWTGLLILWIQLGIPLGPGVGIDYVMTP